MLLSSIYLLSRIGYHVVFLSTLVLLFYSQSGSLFAFDFTRLDHFLVWYRSCFVFLISFSFYIVLFVVCLNCLLFQSRLINRICFEMGAFDVLHLEVFKRNGALYYRWLSYNVVFVSFGVFLPFYICLWFLIFSNFVFTVFRFQFLFLNFPNNCTYVFMPWNFQLRFVVYLLMPLTLFSVNLSISCIFRLFWFFQLWLYWFLLNFVGLLIYLLIFSYNFSLLIL